MGANKSGEEDWRWASRSGGGELPRNWRWERREVRFLEARLATSRCILQGELRS